ncbi:SPOR domain-containing protein [Zoogloea sp. 1C4]|uniref:SPOR domain-containing protein n=1 Tax=Zoogloea sp. 1C4 TaxID=2570190 RepID=UPI0012921DF1|nr:SPOR domain-containing protein [Zoogloea sp. 1C4]
MTDRPDVPDDDEDEDPRRQLWVRAGVAGGLIAVLLGGLAVFDHLSRPPQPEAAVVPTKPIAPAQVTPLPEPGRDAPPDVVRAAAPTEPEPQPPVEGSSTPPPLPTGDKGDRLVERTRKPVEETRPVLRPGSQSVVAAPAAEPARKRDAAPAAVAPAVAPVAQATQPRGVAVPSAAPSAATPASTPATAPAAVAAPAPAAAVPAPVAVVKTPVASDAQGGYAVQVGVFGTAAQAEALRSRLSAAGIPAQLETRVVVGPFNDRRDAVAAQNRLQDKGFSAGELIPFRR